MCEICNGELTQQLPDGVYPCPACLTYPATEDVRAVAREWLGFDVWHAVMAHRTVRIGPWFVCGEAVIPLHLSGGKDMAALVLAKRADIPILMLLRMVQNFAKHNDAHLPFRFNKREAELSAIPIDAPADLREGRALALCLAATEPVAGEAT